MAQKLKYFSIVAVTCIVIPAISHAQINEASKIEVKLASEIKWRQLNPARGDASPQAGTIWGDQTKEGESGFLVKFVDGFSSPPHIHNITYRGIVLGGGLHNDDPKAEPMWMPAGSYWTQPAGEVHITAARGSSIGYVEIQSGPYLVKPSAEVFDNGERPINVDVENIVWLNASNTTWIQGELDSNASKKAKMTFMWGDPNGDQINSTMVKLPKGFTGKLRTESSTFKVIVIDGQTKLHLENGNDEIKLTAGGYFGSEGTASHHITSEDGATIYVRTKGKYSVAPE